MVNLYRVRTTFAGIQGAPYLSTFYFLQSAGTAIQAVTATGTFWGAVDNNLPSALSWATDSDVAVIDQATGDIQSLQSVTPQTGTGSISGAVLHSPAEQGLLRLRTGIYASGREVRGRIFIPGMSNSTSTSSGAPTTTFINSVTTAANTLITTANTTLCVWSRKNGVAQSVVAVNVWTQFAVLRSRRD